MPSRTPTRKATAGLGRFVVGASLSLTACGNLTDDTAGIAGPDAVDAGSTPPSADASTSDATGTNPPNCPAPPNVPVSAAVASNVVPLPVSITAGAGSFVLVATSTIRTDPSSPELFAIANSLAARLRHATGYALPVVATSAPRACGGAVTLLLSGNDAGASDAGELGDEGYDLIVSPDEVRIIAPAPAGVFYGAQTLRQLFPAELESAVPAAATWAIPAATIHDFPRYAWRGTMLDVARHFFSREDVETYLDLLALFKINTFHIHLSDDQGWRIAIDAWPNLATYGGSTEVGGGPGGYYSHADYAELVAYAKERYITIVPEIDMPGHTNAALASYASLNCNGVAPPLYTDTNVGFSSLCVANATTYTFVHDVLRELASLTPGAWLHVGGDEASVTPAADFQSFFANVAPLVGTVGKRMIGWDAVGQLPSLPASSLVQYWAPADGAYVTSAIQKGAKVIMSPANKTYMDMKYDDASPFGQVWAGYIDERTAYSWDPATLLPGVTDPQIVGLEAPLWSELLSSLSDAEYMAFPRIMGYAEIGWSPASGRSFDAYQARLGTHGPRLRALGVRYHVSSEVAWQ